MEPKGIVFYQIMMLIVIVVIIAIAGVILARHILYSEDIMEDDPVVKDKGVLSVESSRLVMTRHSEPVSGTYEYDFSVVDTRFTAIEGYEDIRFVVVADFKNRVSAFRDGPNLYEVSLPEDEILTLDFSVDSDKPPENREFVHLTFWEASDCLEDFFSVGFQDKGIKDLIKRCAEFYIGSADIISGWAGRAFFGKYDNDPEQLEIWEFRLTDDPNDNEFTFLMDSDATTCDYWSQFPESIPPNYCIIATREEDNYPDEDGCAITIASPGSEISARYNNILEGLATYTSYCENTDKACELLSFPWMASRGDWCEDEKCILAYKTDKHHWYPKYGLICSDWGYWYVCDESSEGYEITADGVNYICQGTQWNSV